ncbi:ATP-binding cassette domain-containing protein [Rhodoferax sp. PAMC 29310]|uniref:ABC transporter ATP-binding protein n=1 Tax=Rhodoferax sp. PAMC 29310 TaxID=2822760 RepID=UPI001F0B2670|nr:ATP-binding cassette domain-containing protein [Rhodoferax sp. PAMC 29310]
MSVDGLTFNHPGRPLWTHFDVSIPPGVTLVCGGDGCGKSTLLRLLAGELRAQAGRFVLNGAPVAPSHATYQQQVFWTDMRSEAFEQITPLAYFDSLRPRYPNWDEAAVAGLAEGLSLTPHLHKPIYMLSTGSKRKVWLAAALAAGTQVTLIDDPFSALDKSSTQFLLARFFEAASHPTRAWVLADYQAPGGVPLAEWIDLPD